MNIIVNGENIEILEAISIDGLLEKLGAKDKVMAAAIDMEIVKKENWDKVLLKDGDRVELLQFVGGG